MLRRLFSTGPRFQDAQVWGRLIACLLLGFLFHNGVFAQQAPPLSPRAPADRTVQSVPAESLSQPKAVALLHHTIDRLANGPAFNAAVRQRVWAFGREVLGIGTYEQAGYGSGRFNLQLTMFDGVGKHTLQQISDGRLAWTRTMIADQVSLRRVDVGRLDEWIPPDRLSQEESQGHSPEAASGDRDSQSSRDSKIPPRLKVGAWTERLDTIQSDHVLRLGSSTIESRPVLVITGTLKDTVRQNVLAAADQDGLRCTRRRSRLPLLPHPIPIPDLARACRFGSNFGRIRLMMSPEKRRKPIATRMLVTLIEMFALHPMAAPPVQRFRFENQDSDVNFVNETDRYLQRYGVRITDSQRRLLLR